MFGLNEAEYNIVKRAAKECMKDLKVEVTSGNKYDHIAAGIITKHHAPISTLITRTKFVWLAGYTAGRWGKPGEYE